MPTVYTIMDFKADGKGIAFGKVSTEEGFDVNMITKFRQNVFAEQGMNAIGNVIAGYGTNGQVSLLSLNAASRIIEIWYDGTVSVDSSGIIDINLYVGNYRNHSRSGLIFVSINDTGNQNLGFTCVPYLSNNNSWITYGDALFNLGANGGKISPAFSLINTQLHCIITPAAPSNFANKEVNVKIARFKIGV